MTIEGIAFWMVIGGLVLVCIGIAWWTRHDDTTVRIDPTASGQWLDEVQDLNPKRRTGKL